MGKRILKLTLIIIFTSGVLLGYINVNKAAANHKSLPSSKNGTEQSIPFKCIYSGFLINYTNKIEQGFLPRSDVIFDTKEQWEAFQKKYLYNDIAIYYIFNYSINFTKQSLIYHPIVSAKQDVYSMANKITKITKDNYGLKYDIEDMNISVSSLNDTNFLFTSIIAIDKKYLRDIKK